MHSPIRLISQVNIFMRIGVMRLYDNAILCAPYRFYMLIVIKRLEMDEGIVLLAHEKLDEDRATSAATSLNSFIVAWWRIFERSVPSQATISSDKTTTLLTSSW